MTAPRIQSIVDAATFTATHAVSCAPTRDLTMPLDVL